MKKSRITLAQHRLRRRPVVLFLVAAVALAMFSLATSHADASPGANHADAPHQSQDVPSAAIQLFASEVETLGAYNYPDTFAGAVLTPTGVTEVYALSASDGALIRAINTINQSRYPVEVLATPRSYNQLNALNAKLMAANNAIKARGVTLSQSVPDPATGSIKVSVIQPDASAIALLSADQKIRTRVGAAITVSNYQAAVSALLDSELGQGFTVESRYLSAATIPIGKNTTALPARTQQAIPKIRKSPFDDVPPFYDGDSIIGTLSFVPCTGGFFVRGNRSGHAFLLTAGHCSQNNFPDDWDINPGGTGIGPLSTNYWIPGSTNDFLTIYAPGGALPYVWWGGNNLHPVAAELLPALGVQIAFDGSKTGEVPHNTVTGVNATDMNVTDSNSGRVYNISPVVQAVPPQATVSCQLGDSGGPAYQRTSGSPVDAVGTIAAFFGAPGITIICSAQQIGYEERITDSSLITTGGL